MSDVLKNILQSALAITRDAQLPANLEPMAYAKVIDILAAGITVKEPAAEAPINRRTPTADFADSRTQMLADKLKLDKSVVEQVFSVDVEKGIEVIIGARKLESGKGPAAQQLALLVAGGRQVAGVEEWTSTGQIRAVCEQYGKFDSANFAQDIKELDNYFGFRGKGRMREVKINRPGTEKLTSLITELAENLH